MHRTVLNPIVATGMRGLLPAILLLIASAPCRAGNTAERKAIELQYGRWSAAYARSDTATLLRILAPDFKLKTGTGTVLSRGDYKAILLKRGPVMQQLVDYRIRIDRLTISPRTATAYTTETITDNRHAATSVPTKTVHVHRYRDKWVKNPSGWLLRFSETLAERKTIAATVR